MGCADASGADWQLQASAAEEHRTPAGVVQPFTWVLLRRLAEPPQAGVRARRLTLPRQDSAQPAGPAAQRGR